MEEREKNGLRILSADNRELVKFLAILISLNSVDGKEPKERLTYV